MTRIFKPTGSELVEQPRMKQPMSGDRKYHHYYGNEHYSNDVIEYSLHLASLTRYTINPEDWNQGEEIKEGEFEVVRKCRAVDRERKGEPYDFNDFDLQYKCPDCYLFAIPKRKEQGQEEMQDLEEILSRYVIESNVEQVIKEIQQHYTLTKK